MENSKSQLLFEDAKQSLVGGVNSPVRAYNSVGGTPVFIKSGKGAYITSEDDTTFIDYVLSFGPLILGHANSDVLNAVNTVMQNGTTFGAPTQLETQLANLVKDFYPYTDKVRFVSSGTEAAMSAIRLARGYSKKSIIVKFKGCYHGHADALLVAAGSGAQNLGVPDSLGVLEDVVRNTAVLDYNNTKQVRSFFKEHGSNVAGVILEPVAGNMGLVLPDLNFIAELRAQCNNYDALLIFDEVMCGFRTQVTGTHEWIGIEPDIVVLGKVIGGGLPCGAYAARAEIMDMVAPLGSVYQAGTLSGNPLAMAAGVETLTQLKNGDVFNSINENTTYLVTELNKLISKFNLPMSINHKGSMLSLFMRAAEVNSFEDVQKSDFKLFSKFFHLMLDNGIFLPPSQYETWFSSSCHLSLEIDKTLESFKNAIKEV